MTERALEIKVLRAAAELYDYQTEMSAGRAAHAEMSPGIVLRLAVKELADAHGSTTHLLADLDQEQDNLTEMLWVPRTMIDVRQGDRIRLKGTEAIVSSALCFGWHAVIKMKADSAYWDTFPRPWFGVRMRLEGRERLYEFPEDMPVDIHLTQHEVEMLEHMGWQNRVAVLTSAAEELSRAVSS